MRFVFKLYFRVQQWHNRAKPNCCRFKCIIVDLQVLSIHQHLLVKSYTEWVAPQGVSL